LIIHVKTVGTLRSLEEGPGVFSLGVPEHSSVSYVIERLNLQDWEIGFILVNGQRAARESILKDQDQLTLIAPLVGG
jgi:hypothetical protein